MQFKDYDQGRQQQVEQTQYNSFHEKITVNRAKTAKQRRAIGKYCPVEINIDSR